VLAAIFVLVANHVEKLTVFVNKRKYIMKSFAEFYRQVSKYRLLKEEDLTSGIPQEAPKGTINAQSVAELIGKPDPAPLSAFIQKPNVAAAVSNSGDRNADKVEATANVNGVVDTLRPTQSTLDSSKVLNFALAHLKGESWMNLGQMDSIVSGDDAIMDGHHRWAAALIIEPKMTTQYAKIQLPLEKLITILNAYTVGKLGITAGGGDAGEDLQTAFNNLPDKITAAFNTGFKYGQSNYPANEVKEAMAKVKGANGDAEMGMNIMINNAKKAAADASKTAPATKLPRKDMPVINKEQITQVVSDLQSGNVDQMLPFSKAVYDAIQGGAYQAGVNMSVPKKAGAATNIGSQQNASMAGSPTPAMPTTAGVSFSPQPQNASTFHPGLNMSEQLLVLSGVLTIEQAENNLNKRKRR
jgi:hypothetical protein